MQIDDLNIAVRVYPDAKKNAKESASRSRVWRRPDAMFVFDTETRPDLTQRLMFGSYRFIVGGKCLEEALFYADDLSEGENSVVKEYAFRHGLKLLTRAEFVERLYQAGYKGRCLIVGLQSALRPLARRIRFLRCAGPVRWRIVSRLVVVREERP